MLCLSLAVRCLFLQELNMQCDFLERNDFVSYVMSCVRRWLVGGCWCCLFFLYCCTSYSLLLLVHRSAIVHHRTGVIIYYHTIIMSDDIMMGDLPHLLQATDEDVGVPVRGGGPGSYS